MSRKILLIALSAALVPALAAAAEDTTVYRTTNADGTHSYSQVETQGAEARYINGSGPQQSLQETPGANTPDSEHCTRAKTNLQLLESGQPLQIDTDADGTPEQMNDDQRATQTLLAKSQVSAYCTSNTPAEGISPEAAAAAADEGT